MKRKLVCFIAIGLGVFTSCGGSESEISETVKMEIINGDEQLTITTMKDGKETVQTFSGDEAHEKMKELENESANQDQKRIEKKVVVNDNKGEKEMTITTKKMVK